MAKPRPATRCPKCGGVALLRFGETECLQVCGYDGSGVRAYDAIEENAPTRDRDEAPRTGNRWTDEDLRFLLNNKDELSGAEIGERQGRTMRGVHTKLWKLGLKKRRVRVADLKHSGEVLPESLRRRWTEHEDMRLQDFVSPGQVRAIAERMKRSHNAARVRLWRMGIRARENDGMLSACEVAATYGIDKGRVVRLIELGVLKAERSGRFWRIDPGDVEEAEPWLTRKGRGGRPRKEAG